MKIHISSKLTQYLRNIFKMRFPMINCLKYAQLCKNGIFMKMCRVTTVPYYYVDLPSILCKYWKHGKSPNIPNAEKKALWPFFAAL